MTPIPRIDARSMPWRARLGLALVIAVAGCVPPAGEVPPPRSDAGEELALARIDRQDAPSSIASPPRRIRRRQSAENAVPVALRPSDVPPEQSELPRGRSIRPVLPYEPEPFPQFASAIEDPTGQSLRAFFSALSRVGSQEPGSKATVVQFGDSHTAADFLTGEIRRGLQRRFGDAGRGFLFPGRPFKYYYQRDVKHGGDGPWIPQNGLKADAIEPLGLGGIRMTASSQKASLYLETCSSCDTNNRVTGFEIYYWRKPDGGWFQVRIDGQPYRVVDTRTGPLAAGTRGSTGYFRVELPDGPHRLELYPVEGTVDLFGIVMERDQPGVSYDALGLNGATAFMPARWSWELAGEQLAHRDPDLVVTWYGTNESTKTDFRGIDYREAFRKLIERTREYAPRASCLIVGPPDRVTRTRKKCPTEEIGLDGELLPAPAGCAWESPAVLDEIITVQRNAAYEFGCAFWDARRVMGGAGVMELWAASAPPLAQPDRVHLTKDGYERLGNALLTDLLTEYDRYGARGDRASRGATSSAR